jgi:endonuclease/exonuclease/phosphatase family metal-dependent hydrolase
MLNLNILWDKPKSKSQDYPWAQRRGPLVELLQRADADVIAMQEALPAQLEFLNDELGAEYDYYAVNSRAKPAPQGETCPLWWKRSRFELVDADSFWLNPTNTPGRGWLNVFNPRICSWVELRDLADPQHRSLHCYSTHLDNPPKLMLKQIESRTADGVALCGDLNFNPKRRAYRRLTRNLQDCGTVGTAAAQDRLRTHHLYKVKGGNCIDYIMCGGALACRSYRVAQEAYCTVHDQRGREVLDGPSDHFPLIAELEGV